MIFVSAAAGARIVREVGWPSAHGPATATVSALRSRGFPGDEARKRGKVMDERSVARNLAAVEAHFHSEAEHEVAAALALYTDDIVWETPALNGLDRSYSGKEAVARNYRELWASMRDVQFTFLQRFATADRVVDDSLVTFEVVRDGYWHFPAGSRVEMRLVHIFEMRNGKISRELVFDMGRAV
jgi:ketosteroid isomerase-like protein